MKTTSTSLVEPVEASETIRGLALHQIRWRRRYKERTPARVGAPGMVRTRQASGGALGASQESCLSQRVQPVGRARRRT